MTSMRQKKDDQPPTGLSPPKSDARFGKLSNLAPEEYNEVVRNLDKYYAIAKTQLLQNQSPTVGMYPCRMNEAPQETHVRDSIYCAVATWALSTAYRRMDNDNGRTAELSQSSIKCMRGILFCWMRQSDKVEQFKKTQSEKNALHSKFHYLTGNTLVYDSDHESLQIDCVALYLLFLVQMISSGLEIIFTTDEVAFIQNLVYYIERAYRTPDYGVWQRGSKYNNGSTELHASSIGFVKAALEAINGFNLFGSDGASWSVIYVDIDAHNRNRTIFETILPRESNSKNTDASLIPTLCWPAFALHDETICHRSLEKIQRKLEGKYGYKRFLRDGYKTQIEDRNRKYYKPAEIKNFDGIECEWPIFYLYHIIDGIFRGKTEIVQKYQQLLKPILKHTNDGVVVPMYYYVPDECIEREKKDPQSQPRLASAEGSNGAYFLWGQAVYLISQLLVDGLLHINELDPIKRHLPASARPRIQTRYSTFQGTPHDLVVQVCLISESVRLQQMLANYGILSQTPHQIEPTQVWSPNELTKAYEDLGTSEKLGLKGRPSRPIGGLGTSKIYRAFGHHVITYPLLFEVNDFYLSQDMKYVIDDVKNDLAFLASCWKLSGRPTFCMLIREENIRGPHVKQYIDLLANIKLGNVDGIKVNVGRIQSILSSGCVENLDFLQAQSDDETSFKKFEELHIGRSSFKSLQDMGRITDTEEDENIDAKDVQNKSTWDVVQFLRNTENMHAQAQLLQILLNREGPHYRIDDSTMQERIEKLLHQAGIHQQWSVVRLCASVLGKLVDSLAPSVTSILVRGKQITIGMFGHEEEVIDKPVTPNEIKHILYDKCRAHNITEVCLQQEMILNIGKFISTTPQLFEGMLKIRIGWILHAMQLELNTTHQKSVYQLSPNEVKRLLFSVMQSTVPSPKTKDKRSPLSLRQLNGSLNRVPRTFYDDVWNILERTPGGLRVVGYHLPQQPTLSDMTLYELNFALLVEQMLSKILDPAYRQLTVEGFMVMSKILTRNPELEFHKTVDMDKIIHEAFAEFQKDLAQRGQQEKSDDMILFYSTPQFGEGSTTSYLAKAAINNLLQGGIKDNCHIS